MCVAKPVSSDSFAEVPAISQHLRKLKDGGLVHAKKVGQTVFYTIVEQDTKIIKPVLDNIGKTVKKVREK